MPNMSTNLTETAVEHVVLLGDSILDNKRYVAQTCPDVCSHLQGKISSHNWTATNCAVDGAITLHVIRDQLHTIPPNVTTFVLSTGGNDGLEALHDLANNSRNWWPWNFIRFLIEIRSRFKDQYTLLLEQIKKSHPDCNIIVCTIYYPQFGAMSPLVQMVSNIGVNLMSDVIMQCALCYGTIPIIDLRHVFDRKEDYANSIEPGVPGSDKMTNNIVHILRNHDFNTKYRRKRDLVYALNQYSDGMDPVKYGKMHWRLNKGEKQAGGVATRFFRRAFNERENANIKMVGKAGILGVTAVIGYVLIRIYRR